MTNEANPDLQSGMTDPDITSNQEVVPTPGHRKGLRLKEDLHQKV